MERDSLGYRLRRKLQVAAFGCVPHSTLSRVYYKICLHENLNLKNPQTFNEKLQWLKLNYLPDNQTVVQCTDKYQVRSYIESKGYGNTLTKLIDVWEDANSIDWNKLPSQFVLKCTHGCAYNIICRDKKSLDKKAAVRQLDKWLKEDFSKFNVELHYGRIKPRRIICEEYLGEKMIDYKFFCFHGEPQFFYVSKDLVHDRQAEIGFFNMDGSKIPMVRKDYKDIGDANMPECFAEMVEEARILSADFPFVRVDFFLFGDSYKFAELTFTPAAAMMPINPKKYDLEWGEMIDLNKIVAGQRTGEPAGGG